MVENNPVEIGFMLENSPIEISFFERFKLYMAELWEKLRTSKETIFDMLLYAGFGFLAGYLLKKFGLYILFFVIALFVLQQFDVISLTVYWEKIQAFFGLQQVPTIEGNFLTIVWDWIKVNMLVVISFSVGFLLGIKVK